MSAGARLHPEIEDLSAWVDREGTPEELAAIAHHVESCGACREKARAFGSTAALVAALPRESAGDALVARVSRSARAARPPRRTLVWTAVAAAGVALGAIVTFRVVSVQQDAMDPAAPWAQRASVPAKADRQLKKEIVAAAAPEPELAQDEAKLGAAAATVGAKAQASPVAPSSALADSDAPARPSESLAREEERSRPVDLPRAGDERKRVNAQVAASGSVAAGSRADDMANRAQPQPADASSRDGSRDAGLAEADRLHGFAEGGAEGAAAPAEAEAAAADAASPARRAGERAASAPSAPPAPAAQPALNGALVLPGVVDAEPGSGKDAAGAASTPVALSPDVQAPVLVHRVLLPRTVSAGRAVLEIVVTERGTVRVTRVVSATPGLEAPAIAAVEQWRYQPARLRGRDQAVRMTVVVEHPRTD